MQVVEINGLSARCEARGAERVVSLFLLQHETLCPGDSVLIHLGYATQKISDEQARSTWELYDAMLAQEPQIDLASGLCLAPNT